MTKGRNSTKISIRIPDKLLTELRERAKKRNMGLSVFIKECLADKFSINLTERRMELKQIKELEKNELGNRLDACAEELGNITDIIYERFNKI